MVDNRWITSIQHAQKRGFALKRITLQCIRNGDVDGMRALFAPQENLSAISGALSDDLDHAVIACLFTWAQAAFAAETGGLSLEESSALFYVYARQAYEARSVAEVLDLDRRVLVDLAEAVLEKQRDEDGPQPVNEGIRYIDEQLYDGVTAQRVADHLHFSVDYLTRLFREETGMTLSAYIRARKIEDAKALLEGSRLEIREIGSRLGFTTHSHFTSVFNKLVGMTPREYRALALAFGAAPPSAKEQTEALVSQVPSAV